MAIDKHLLACARAYAARRGTSISSMLAEELRAMVERDAAYEQAKLKALALLDARFHLGGAPLPNREILHDRKNLR